MSSLSNPTQLICPFCGQGHRLPALEVGERAQCIRCDTTLMCGPRWGSDGALAFAIAGLLLAGLAVSLPFVEVSKLQAARASFAFSGVRAMWDAGMHLLAIWVFLCGLLAPFLLLGTMAALLLPTRLGWSGGGSPLLARAARALESWSMPEVHVLAVLVAFAKLGSLVHVSPGPGLWCYVAMSGCLLAAWHHFELSCAPRALTSGQRQALAAP